jgi:hypothetical protein
MELNFFPEGYTPKPKDEVAIDDVEIAVYPDRRRVYIHVVITPFQERPNLLITARNADGNVAAELSIIETMHHDMEFTMHLRSAGDTAGTYQLSIDVFYETRTPPQAQRIESFVVPEAP